MMTSLKDQLQSYGAYHRDLRNKLTKPAKQANETLAPSSLV